MKKRILKNRKWGLVLSAIALFILISVKTNAQQIHATLTKTSVETANTFLASLNAEQKGKAHLSFDDTSRTKWSNFPLEQADRKGIWFNDLTDAQKMHVHTLLRTMLSTEGYQKALFIMQYDEDIKQRMTKANIPIAHRYGHEKYWITIFGEPREKAIWGWKFEGHHLSLNFTYSPKGITCTPMFTGINPALTNTGPFAGRYIMYNENELGKQIFVTLTPALKQKALLGKHPTNADPMAQTGKEAFLKEKSGVVYTEMTKAQQDMVGGIIAAWVGNLTPQLAHEKMDAILKNKEAIRFVWYGTENIEELHYYRIYTPSFIIEMTNRDGAIQHLHSLWRNIDEDFLAK